MNCEFMESCSLLGSALKKDSPFLDESVSCVAFMKFLYLLHTIYFQSTLSSAICQTYSLMSHNYLIHLMRTCHVHSPHAHGPWSMVEPIYDSFLLNLSASSLFTFYSSIVRYNVKILAFNNKYLKMGDE